MRTQEIIEIDINNLNLWTENPRDPVESTSTDYDIIIRAIDDNSNRWNLKKLLDNMGDYYDLSELPTVVQKNGNYIVYDGNKRISLLKIIKNHTLKKKLESKYKKQLQLDSLEIIDKIHCNVCDETTALTNVARKHENNGDWTRLDRDYFFHNHLGEPKSLFVCLEEKYNLIENFDKMNKRFVKDEVFTPKNLHEIGFDYKPETGIKSIYTYQESKDILTKAVELITDDIVTTRKNRGQLKEPLLIRNPELEQKIDVFRDDRVVFENEGQKSSTDESKVPQINKETPKPKNRTSIDIGSDMIFGRKLILEKGPVNNLYRAIENIYDSNKRDDIILPIVGMSLRLILDVAARIYLIETEYPNKANDQVYKPFLKIAKSDMKLESGNKNYLSLTKDWLDNNSSIEGLLGKYAHGNINVNRNDILNTSYLVADILEYYFKK